MIYHICCSDLQIPKGSKITIVNCCCVFTRCRERERERERAACVAFCRTVDAVTVMIDLAISVPFTTVM